MERGRVRGNVLRDAVPERRTQRLVGSERVGVVVGLAGRVLKFPRRFTGGSPGVGVGDVGVVGDRVDDGEGLRVDEVVAEAGIQLLVCRHGRRDPGDGGGRVGGFDGRVVGINDAEFVVVRVAEEGATDGIVEAVDDGVPGEKMN